MFLDRNLVIRNFTPAASSFFNLRAADVGRPLTDLSSTLDYPELKQHIASVFSTGDDARAPAGPGRARAGTILRPPDPLPRRRRPDRWRRRHVRRRHTLAEAEEHQQVLISELNHRVKNMLSVVISIANHTAGRCADTPRHSPAP